MVTRTAGSRWVPTILVCALACAGAAFGQQPPADVLNEDCIVSVLNRNVQVAADGTWVLPNIPASFGRVRARATCVTDGVTRSGESAPFDIPANGSVDVPPIVLGPTTPIPTSMTITAPTAQLETLDETVQLTVVATFTGSAPVNVTASGSGTTYAASNPQIASVSDEGVVTALRSGTVLVQALNEGTQGLISIRVALSGGVDSDGDGIPDDAELDLGLNPEDPTDAISDFDHDGLTNAEEFEIGSDLRDADTDDDGLSDGEEVTGASGYVTSPLLADTDADGINDLTEIQTGSDPTDPASYNLSQALESMEVTPSAFTLIVNSISGIATVQLAVVGHLIDGHTIDLTSTQRGTNYASSDLGVCNFGAPDGRVFASSAGSCTITVSNGPFSADSNGTVELFSPFPVSYVAIPGFANDVAVAGDFAFVAAGGSGLQVVDLGADRTNPQVVASLGLSGVAMGITIVGDRAYVAGGSAGLHVIDIANPLAPVLLGSFSTGSTARAVRIRGTTAFVANSSNLHLVNVANPGAMITISTLSLGGTTWDVDLDLGRNLALVATGSGGVRVVDVSNTSSPALLGTVSTGDARSVAVAGQYAIVADHSTSMRSIDVQNPSAPAILSTTPQNLGGLLNDVVLSAEFALGADVYFVNGIPIVDTTDPGSLAPRAILSFPARDDNGMGIAVDTSFAYLTTEHSNLNRGGSSGDSRLYIGQFRPRVDLAGVPPTVSILSPAGGQQLYEGAQLTVAVEAIDDVAVQSVQFLVDGEVAFTTTSSPYEYTFTVPTGINSLTLGARALDLAGNVGTAEDVVVPVLPDPLTLVTGLVVDAEATPVTGAVVMAPGGRTGVTGPEGRFEIPSVPTVLGDLFVTVSYDAPDGSTLTGTSQSVPPVLGGVTDVGTVTIIAAQFETDYGTYLTSCDDCYYLRTLPFAFPFYGTDRSSTYVGTNGYLTFGSGDNTYVESLPAFANRPRIAGFFDDLYARSTGAVYVNDTLPGRFIVTHDRVQHYIYGGSNTIQIQLYSDGRIVFAYHGLTAITSGTIVGVTPGPGAPAEQLDYSTNRNFTAPDGSAIYEYFNSSNPFDLDYGFVVFTPTGTGGYTATTMLPPAVAQSSLVTGGAEPPPGAPDLAGAEIIVHSSTDTDYVGMANADASGQFAVNQVPAGGIEVVVRRDGKIVARGFGVFDGGDLSEAQVLSVLVAAPSTETKQVPQE